MLEKINPSRYLPFQQEATAPIQQQLEDVAYFGIGSSPGVQSNRGSLLKNILQSQLQGARAEALGQSSSIIKREEDMIRTILAGILQNIGSLKG